MTEADTCRAVKEAVIQSDVDQVTESLLFLSLHIQVLIIFHPYMYVQKFITQPKSIS